MSKYADKERGDKGKLVGKSGNREYGVKPGIQLLDNRPESIARSRVQEMANISPQAMRATQSQAMADRSAIQRMKNVYLETDEDDKKSLTATGVVEDFKNGTSAGSRGWIGVEKYRAHYKIEDDENVNKGDVGPLQNTFTNPEAGHVLAKQNGGNGGDAENIFAQDGGTNNSIYKVFENKMRLDLNKYDDDDEVLFKAYLVGTDIQEGVISDAGLSEASEISSDESNSSSSSDEESMSETD